MLTALSVHALSLLTVVSGRRAYAPCAVVISLPGHPRFCAPLGVVIAIIVGTVVGVLAAGESSSSLASSILNANAASSTPVHGAIFVACGGRRRAP